MLNHINKFAPAIEVGEFLIISQTAWSDLDADGAFHNADGFLQQVDDVAAKTRYEEALDAGWVEAGIVWGESERLTVMVKPAQAIESQTVKVGE